MEEIESLTSQYLVGQSDDQLANLQKIILAILQERGKGSKAISIPKSKNGIQKALKTILKSRSKAAMRPLNSFIAFRTYYSGIFGRFQQKEISGWMNVLWKEDFFTSKWTIIAKGYSVIRDRVGKENAPLDRFLSLVCPLINIIHPEIYLVVMGWTTPLVHNHKELKRLFVPDRTQYNVTTGMSAMDIVEFVEAQGYAAGVNAITSVNEVAALTMAVQPTTFENSATTSPSSHSDTDTEAATNEIAKAAGFSTMEEYEAAQQAGPMSSIELEYHENNILLAASGDQHPFNYQFNPVDDAEGNGLLFDPTNAGEFESFDMTQFIDFNDSTYGVTDRI